MGVINLDQRVAALEAKAESSGSAIDAIDAELTATFPDEKTLVLKSSTASSTKYFKITVIDNGTISATEITG